MEPDFSGLRETAQSREQKQIAQLDKAARPAQVILGTTEFGEFVWTIRRHCKIKQAQLAARAQVGRQWIVAMEQGKPSLAFGHVMRVIEALGFEMELKPVEPLPPWIKAALRDKLAYDRDLEYRRRQRRRAITSRRLARRNRLNENAEKKPLLDLD